jgi:hypothetical protein
VRDIWVPAGQVDVFCRFSFFMSFFYLRILITTLVSSNYSYNVNYVSPKQDI